MEMVTYACTPLLITSHQEATCCRIAIGPLRLPLDLKPTIRVSNDQLGNQPIREPEN